MQLQLENMGRLILLAILISFLFFCIHLNITTAAGDTIAPNQPMKDGETLISAGGAFELGFFSPNGSSQRYLGIWYSNIPGQIVVWVANREAPIGRTTGVLELTVDGNLAISDHTNNVIWSTNTFSKAKAKASNPIAQLMDDGNLQVLNDSKGLLWQSFDSPSDTMLLGMKIGRDLRTNQVWNLTSWKSASDPSPGNYTFMLNTHGLPETYLMNESDPIWRSGAWEGQGFDGVPSMNRSNYISFHLFSNQDEVYYSFEVMNESIVSRLLVSYDGKLERFVWLDHHWLPYWQFPVDPCDSYNPCGSNGVCQDDGSTDCSCLRGFEPQSPEQWDLRDWAGGCSRRVPLDCGTGKGDGFVKVPQLKLPDTSNTTSWDSSKSHDECQDWCLQNCSCLAFAVISPVGGGCVIWFGGLIDIREITGGGDDLYVRLAASELDEALQYHKKKLGRNRIIKIAVSSGGVILIVIGVSISICMVWNKHRKEVEQRRREQPQTTLATAILAGANELADDILMDSELLMFTFSTIAASTSNFSNKNKIGEGGFGSVYKGILPNGQEIAVKRLSKGSIQGVQEFKNEIILIANLQHKNLVRLLGCCIKGEERILVYEYMPNRSLDCFIFDPIRAVFLDWKRRSRVIHGVAQGLLYLHNYSRLRIIHRDLKSSNILLDSDMNPKISDFGIARIFGGNQDQANTNRVIGTYGYMPPEYAIEGYFSEKSDVFSFGVLLLEIVSGKKNGGHQIGDSRFLIGHAWQLWKDGKILELMNPILRYSCPLQEVIRYVHVGLLCVQEDAADRPNMSSVISFLSTDSAALPSPVKVAFSNLRTMSVHFHSRGEDYSSSNELTVTAISPR